jgi:hypothetical protein
MLPAIDVDEITERARQARPAHALLTALTFIPFLLGWTARQIWVGLTFTWTAVRVGWRAAGQDDERDQLAQQQPKGWN